MKVILCRAGIAGLTLGLRVAALPASPSVAALQQGWKWRPLIA